MKPVGIGSFAGTLSEAVAVPVAGSVPLNFVNSFELTNLIEMSV